MASWLPQGLQQAKQLATDLSLTTAVDWEFLRKMDHHPHQPSHWHRVTAAFGDHEQSFDLVDGTTLAQLSERLAHLAGQNHSWPTGISILFDAVSESDTRGREAVLPTTASPSRSELR